MTDKTLEAVAQALHDSYTEKWPFISMAQAAIAVHDSELKKHIKVLVEALNKLAHDEFPAVGFRMDVAKQALASLPEELRGL